MNDSHGNNPRQRGKNGHQHKPYDGPQPVKVPADSVTYGENISRNGKTVWVIRVDGKPDIVAASADEARRKYKDRGRVKC